MLPWSGSRTPGTSPNYWVATVGPAAHRTCDRSTASGWTARSASAARRDALGAQPADEQPSCRAPARRRRGDHPRGHRRAGDRRRPTRSPTPSAGHAPSTRSTTAARRIPAVSAVLDAATGDGVRLVAIGFPGNVTRWHPARRHTWPVRDWTRRSSARRHRRQPACARAARTRTPPSCSPTIPSSSPPPSP